MPPRPAAQRFPVPNPVAANDPDVAAVLPVAAVDAVLSGFADPAVAVAPPSGLAADEPPEDAGVVAMVLGALADVVSGIVDDDPIDVVVDAETAEQIAA